ncbi:hypothetical protein LCGC14_0548190 [marine sediment metagenome]|uniref:Zona occludens toxin N-terminal domain-containing protein n=1 Tax=marine sediment metagenome TaxID=412755 RepID=A0A0F9UYZ8_9ZZZZ
MGYKWPTVKQVEGQNPWTSYFFKRTNQKNNCINLIVTSMPGEGKSYSLLSQFCEVDPDFDVSEQCVFKAKKLIEYFRGNRIVKGKPILYDESEVDLDSADWQNVTNKALGVFFSTARFRNYIFGTTCPFLTSISKKVRKLMNCHWKAMGWSKGYTIIKPFTLEYNGDVDRFYRKRLLVKKLDGSTTYCNQLRLPKPPLNIIKDYEKMKKEFTTDVYDELLSGIELKEKLDKQKASGLKPLTPPEEKTLNVIKRDVDIDEAAIQLGVTVSNVYQTMQRIKNKGIQVTGIRGNDGKVRKYEIIDYRETKKE